MHYDNWNNIGQKNVVKNNERKERIFIYLAIHNDDDKDDDNLDS